MSKIPHIVAMILDGAGILDESRMEKLGLGGIDFKGAETIGEVVFLAEQKKKKKKEQEDDDEDSD